MEQRTLEIEPAINEQSLEYRVYRIPKREELNILTDDQYEKCIEDLQEHNKHALHRLQEKSIYYAQRILWYQLQEQPISLQIMRKVLKEHKFSLKRLPKKNIKSLSIIRTIDDKLIIQKNECDPIPDKEVEEELLLRMRNPTYYIRYARIEQIYTKSYKLHKKNTHEANEALRAFIGLEEQ